MKEHIKSTLEVFEKYNPKIEFPKYDKDRYRNLIKNAKNIDQLNLQITMLNAVWGVGLNKIEQ